MQPHKLTFLLPNFLTASSIFVGILSLIEGSKGHFSQSAWLILLALLFDGLDGRVARMTGATSRFGVEFDSLADIVSFGVAPALLLYFYVGQYYGQFGILISGLYVIFGAVRLARFNVTTMQNDPNVFIGLPIPTAAIAIATSILFFEEYHLDDWALTLLVTTLPVALLMVSNIRYPSFKTVYLDRPIIYKTLILLLLIASLLYLFSAEGLTVLVWGYILYGPIRAVRTMSLRTFYRQS
jgi:CDP-diacylglycerol--serine O-phosphatidyltransferase